MQSALNIAISLKTRYIQAVTLQNLVAVHRKLFRYKEALEHCDRALNIATELGSPLVQDCKELKEKLLNEQSGRNDSRNR